MQEEIQGMENQPTDEFLIEGVQPQDPPHQEAIMEEEEDHGEQGEGGQLEIQLPKLAVR